MKCVCAHAYVLTFCAYTQEHVCKCLCLPMSRGGGRGQGGRGAHAPLGFECYSPLLAATAGAQESSVVL